MGRLPLFRRMTVELQSNCNRDCSFCPRHLDRSGIRKTADGRAVIKQAPTDKIVSVIDQAVALGYQGSIGFHRISESFLDKRYFEIAGYAKARGLRILDHTNTDVFRGNPSLITKMDGQVDDLVIGLYDYTTYAEKVREMAFWRRQFNKTRIHFSLPLENPQPRRLTALGQDALRMRLGRRLSRPCLMIGSMLQVRYDGEIAPCCHDDRCENNLGNAHRDRVADIWNGKNFVEMYEALQKPNSRHRFAACRDCVLSAPVSYLELHFGKWRNRIRHAAFRWGLVGTRIKADPESVARARAATERGLHR